MLTLKNLAVDHGKLRALWDVSLHVGKGERVGLLGANGAGKSTAMGAIVGLYPVAAGEISFDGAPMKAPSTTQTVAGGISLVPEGRRLFPGMSVWENLVMGAYAAPKRELDAPLEQVFGLFPILRQKAAQNAGELSGGQQQMVAIGRALMSRPSLLLLDEPSLGLAPLIVQDMFRAIREINGRGTSVLLVEQNVSMAMELASRAYVMEEGRIVAEGPADDLMNRPEIQQAYLGL